MNNTNSNVIRDPRQAMARAETLIALFAMKLQQESKQSELRLLAMVKGGRHGR
jgi:hypothetical protein